MKLGKKLEENKIKYVSFWNNRKPEYRLKTIIQGDKVYKYPNCNESKKHIEKIKENIDILNKCNIKTLDSYDDEKIISNYTENGISYDKIVIEEFEKNGMKGLINCINKFSKETIWKLEPTGQENNIFDKLKINYKKEDIQDLHFVKNGLWDLNFQNAFLIDNEIYIYDQEWSQDNIPAEFIIYRELLIFERLKRRIDINEVYKELDLLKYKDLFDRLESKISSGIMQDKICEISNRPMRNTRGLLVENYDLKHKNLLLENDIYENKKKLEESRTRVQEKNDELGIKNNEIQNLKQENEQKNNELESLRQIINNIYNSKSWKVTKPLRKITGFFKK